MQQKRGSESKYYKDISMEFRNVSSFLRIGINLSLLEIFIFLKLLLVSREVWKLGVDESRFTEQQYTSSQLDDISLRYSSRSQCMQQSGVCVG